MTTGRLTKRSGKWAYVISLPYDPIQGRYPQRWRQGFATQQEAKNALAKELAALADNPTAVTGMKVSSMGLPHT